MDPSPQSLSVTPGLMLVETVGTSMWPAIRTGDLVFGHPFRPSEIVAPGTVLVVAAPDGLIAHRLMRCRGRPGKRRFLLAGDLSGPDFPFREHQICGVAEVIYRKGIGFLDIEPPLGFERTPAGTPELLAGRTPAGTPELLAGRTPAGTPELLAALGPIGRRMVSRFARLWEWLERHRAAPPSDSSIRLLS